MMNSVKTIFEARTQEIVMYYNFLNDYINTSSNKELNKILKSNLILMLYNLVESSISNAIEEIHNNMYVNNTTFDSLNIELKKVLIKQLKNNEEKNFVLKINNLTIDIVNSCFDKQNISNGNIDHRTISKLGREYGFNTKTIYEKTKHGSCLENIRAKRNDLAHGTFSFTEVSKEYTVGDLEEMKNETISYLGEILDNINTYLLKQQYKAI